MENWVEKVVDLPIDVLLFTTASLTSTFVRNVEELREACDEDTYMRVMDDVIPALEDVLDDIDAYADPRAAELLEEYESLQEMNENAADANLQMTPLSAAAPEYVPAASPELVSGFEGASLEDLRTEFNRLTRS
jgi:hypothetical protein